MWLAARDVIECSCVVLVRRALGALLWWGRARIQGMLAAQHSTSLLQTTISTAAQLC